MQQLERAEVDVGRRFSARDGVGQNDDLEEAHGTLTHAGTFVLWRLLGD
ncbi:MAG: hypothetical protein WAK11_11995 [Candidatus Cybelea sp.]